MLWEEEEEEAAETPDEQQGDVVVGQRWRPMLRVENPAVWELPPAAAGPGKPTGGEPPPMRIPARPRLGFKDVVWDPPDVSLRSVVR